jgi:hypothetical protein
MRMGYDINDLDHFYHLILDDSSMDTSRTGPSQA